MNKAIFLDKDGTLITNIPYNINPDMISLESNIIDGLKLLNEDGFQFIIVSNQAGVAYGYFKEEDLKAVERKIKALLIEEKIPITGFYYCPHHPKGEIKEYATACNCRKPAPGMLLRAAQYHNIDLSQSWMIGDILNDVEAGNRAGCKTILINNGHETEWNMKNFRKPYLISSSIDNAAALIHISEEMI